MTPGFFGCIECLTDSDIEQHRFSRVRHAAGDQGNLCAQLSEISYDIFIASFDMFDTSDPRGTFGHKASKHQCCTCSDVSCMHPGAG